MTNEALLLKVKQRLNKLDSQDYDNLEPWQVLEAFNKAQLQWARQKIDGMNARQLGDEATKQTIDDLQVLLDEQPVEFGGVVEELYQEVALPADYLGFKRISASAGSSCCPARPLRIYPCKVANVDAWLHSEHHKPSFSWGETFYTLQSNRLQVYTGLEFTIARARLIYYRRPKPVRIVGVLDLTTSLPALTAQTCELAEAIAEALVDKTVGILAGDTENSTQYQRAEQTVAVNT